MGACSCRYVPLLMMPKRWWASCVYSYARSKARLCSSGTARLFIALTRSRTFSSGERPNAGIWNYLKRVELGNVCCSDLDQLYRKLIQAKERLRHKKEIIKSCSRQCGYLV